MADTTTTAADPEARARRPADSHALAYRAPGAPASWWTGTLADGPGGLRLLTLSATPGEAMSFPTAEEAREVLACCQSAFPHLPGIGKLAVAALPAAAAAPAEQPGAALDGRRGGSALASPAATLGSPNLGGWRP